MTDNASHTYARSRADRAWAWAGALLAAGVSIAVNIAHAGPHAPSAFEAAELMRAGLPVPGQVGSWGFAAFSATLPVMVLIAAEQVARRLLGRSTLPVMLGIGICAYSLSFWHTVQLLGSWGEPWPLRMTGAVAVDGLAVASVIALWFAASVRALDGPAPVPGRTPNAPAPVRTSYAPSVRTAPFPLPDTGRPDVQPADVRTVNGMARPDVRTALAERPVSGRTLWADAPASGLDEAQVWAAWELAGRPNDWPALAALLGTNPEAARKRAGRR